MLYVAVLALVVSAETPEQRLTELENLVSSMQSELTNLQTQLESTSNFEERITENELRVALLFSELLTHENKFDFSHKFQSEQNEIAMNSIHENQIRLNEAQTKIDEITSKISANENQIIVNTSKITENMQIFTDLDLETDTGVNERLTQVEQINADMKVKLTTFENEIYGIQGIQASISTNSDSIANNIADITTNSVAIVDNARDINTNFVAISDNMAYINTNSAAINNNASFISTNSDAIVANASKISTNSDSIAKNIADISANSVAISTNTLDISLKSLSIQDNDSSSSSVSAISTALAANIASTSANAVSISTNIANISTNTQNITDNISSISTNTKDIAQNISGISTNTQKITDNISGISTNTRSINDNTNDISTNSAAISTSIVKISENSENIDLIQNPDNTCLNDFDSLTGEYCGEWAGAMLKKVPLWGEKVSDDDVNFEWPTPEIFARMTPNVSLQSIEFKKYHQQGSAISSVRVNLSNGYSSSVFENEHWKQHANHEIITFDPDMSIREVAAHDGQYWTGKIRFMDSAGNELYVYNPSGDTHKTTSYMLSDDEELIGVYGVKDRRSYFSSFGFIVKVKANN